MEYIYKLVIGNDITKSYHYIGRTNKLNVRYLSHKKSCYNRSKKSYHRKVYKKIRELGIKKDNFKEYVKMRLVATDTKENIRKLERLLINKEHSYNLNMIL